MHLNNIALGEKNKKAFLYFDRELSGLASVYKRRLDHFNIGMKKQEEINVIKLDSYCEEKNIIHIDLIKLDVEGYEYKILLGAASLLKNNAIDYIQFEFGGCNIDSRTYFQDFYYLLKNNYNIYRILKNDLYLIDKYREADEIFVTTNYLAINKNNDLR